MNLHHTPASTNFLLYSRVDSLSPSSPPLGVEPAADNNMMRVSEGCLFMRTARGSQYGGRFSMSWWATITWPFFFAFTSIGLYLSFLHFEKIGTYQLGFTAYYLEHLHIPIGITAFEFIGCFWMHIPWRTQLPIIFNRKTRTVSCMIEERFISRPWEELQAHIKDVNSFAVGGAPLNEGGLCLSFSDPTSLEKDRRLRTVILATQEHPQAIINRGIYGAAQVWEYIRLYMEKGEKSLPASSASAVYRAASFMEIVRYFNPAKSLRVQNKAWLLFAIPFFLLVAIPFSILLIIGDVTYMWLGRFLPRQAWPAELIEACEGTWDGTSD